jgi:2-oxoglutarate dehydrogenase E1 component
LDGRWSPSTSERAITTAAKTAISKKVMKEVGGADKSSLTGSTRVQDRGPLLEAKAADKQTGACFDWATGEALAFGSLVTEGLPVRLSGFRIRCAHVLAPPLAFIDQEQELLLSAGTIKEAGSVTRSSTRCCRNMPPGF